jgi:hypothetical protein
MTSHEAALASHPFETWWFNSSTRRQDEHITWPQERQAPDLERTEGQQEWLMCLKKCEHQIFLHCLAQASQIWLFSLNNTSRLLECESLPKSWSMLIHSCSQAIQISSDCCTYNMISLWGSNSLKRGGDGSPGIYKGVYYTFLISLHQLDILLLLCFPPHCHLLHIFSSTSKTWFTV